jgi:hypothetical protein
MPKENPSFIVENADATGVGVGVRVGAVLGDVFDRGGFVDDFDLGNARILSI